MERAALLADARTLEASHLGLTPMPALAPAADARGPEDPGERVRLQEVLRTTGWNISRAAERLGIPRNTLRYRLERHGLDCGEPTGPTARRPAAARCPSVRADAGGGPEPRRWERG